MIHRVRSAWRKSVERRLAHVAAVTWVCLTISIASNHGRYSVKTVFIATGVVVATTTLILASRSES